MAVRLKIGVTQNRATSGRHTRSTTAARQCATFDMAPVDPIAAAGDECRFVGLM
jgi:hypothetical protein